MIKECYRKIRLIATLINVVLKELYCNIRIVSRGKVNETEILLLSHSLEKGMGIHRVKRGYGLERANRLVDLLYLSRAKGDNNKFFYKEGCSVVLAYLEYQKSQQVNVSILEERFSKLHYDSSDLMSGYRMILKEELEEGMQTNWERLIDSKHSLRMYSSDSITKSEFEQAVHNAIKSPSACNRQPWKVYCSFEKGKNQEISKYVPGNKAFESDIPYYCIVTADRKLFGSEEIFQWYVNGGIFLAYLTLSLHALGIGSCIFQWPLHYKEDKRMREAAAIGDSEIIIAVVGFGKYPEQTKCLGAQRKPTQEVLFEF